MDILIEISVVLPLSLPLDFWPASLAQSDARPTGDQDVAGSIPTGSGNILPWRLIMKYSLPSADSRRAVVSFWRKNVHKCWLISLRTEPVQEKCG